MRSHACHHAAAVHIIAHHAMGHAFGGGAFGGGVFGGGTPHVYHHHYHTNGSHEKKHDYYKPKPEPEYEYTTLDEVKSHLLKHLTVQHYRTAADFEKLVQLFLSAKILMKDKIQFLHDCIKGLDVPYFWDKYTDIVAQLPRHVANMDELVDEVIPFHFSLTMPTYADAARDMETYQRNFIAGIEHNNIHIGDLCRILNARTEDKSMADILDYSTTFFSLIDTHLMDDAFKGEATVVSIIKNMEHHNRQVFGIHPYAHSIMEKLLNKGIDANELFALLKPAYAFDHDFVKYTQLLAEFAKHGIDKTVIKQKLHAELTTMANTHERHSDGSYKTDLKYKTLGNNTGKVFCQLAKDGLLPDLELTHDIRKAIFKEVKTLSAAEKGPILQSILKQDQSDFGHVFKRMPHLQFLFGKKAILPDHWKHKAEKEFAKLPAPGK